MEGFPPAFPLALGQSLFLPAQKQAHSTRWMPGTSRYSEPAGHDTCLHPQETRADPWTLHPGYSLKLLTK